MACPVIDAHVRPPSLSDIPVKLIPGAFDLLRQYPIQKLAGLFAGLFAPILKGAIAVSHRLLDGRSLLQKLLKFREEGLEDGKLGCFHGIGDLLGGDGLHGGMFTLCRSVRKLRYSSWMGRCWYSVTSWKVTMGLLAGLNCTSSHLLS